MASKALAKWESVRKTELDELLAAHNKVGGAKPGRRYATEQLNYAYLSAIASQFQGYCRDLHSEAVGALAAAAPVVSAILFATFTKGRKLDQGNANPGNIADDFSRIGMNAFWTELATHGGIAFTEARRKRLEQMNMWRNAIAHNDFDQNLSRLDKLDDQLKPRLKEANRCRTACNRLARQMDEAVGQFLGQVVGTAPW